MMQFLWHNLMFATLVVLACWLGCPGGTAALAQATGQFDTLVRSLDRQRIEQTIADYGSQMSAMAAEGRTSSGTYVITMLKKQTETARLALFEPDAASQLRTTFFTRPGQELAHDRLDVLIHRGDMKFEPHTIKITGSNLSAERFGASAEVPNLVDFNGDGFLDIFITRSGGAKLQPHGNTLLLSDGGWDKFRDVSSAMGIQNLDGYNRQSSIADVNGDGWLDIAIGCDTIGRPDRYGSPHSRLFVFQPKGKSFADGRFEDIAGTRGLEEFGGYTGDPAKDKAGPGISLRDLDNDGDLDLVQTGFKRATESAGFAALDWNYKQLYEHNGWPLTPAMLNTSPRKAVGPQHKQPGLPSFGIGGNHPYFADVVFGDFDNDGWQDVVCLDRAELPGLNTHALFYQNDHGTFRLLKTADTGLDASLTFTGLTHTQLIGARIELTADGHQQTRWLHTNHSYKSGGQLDAHFGLSQAASASVKTTLPDGRLQTVVDLAADHTHSLAVEQTP